MELEAHDRDQRFESAENDFISVSSSANVRFCRLETNPETNTVLARNSFQRAQSLALEPFTNHHELVIMSLIWRMNVHSDSPAGVTISRRGPSSAVP